VELRFASMDDFQPARIAEQITPLRKLLELRNSLANLRSSLIGNEKLETLLQEMIQDQELLRQAGSEAGLSTAAEKENKNGRSKINARISKCAGSCRRKPQRS